VSTLSILISLFGSKLIIDYLYLYIKGFSIMTIFGVHKFFHILSFYQYFILLFYFGYFFIL